MITGRGTCSLFYWSQCLVLSRASSCLTCLPKLLGTSIAWLWSLFPFLCRGRVIFELLFCHLCTVLVTTLGSETALMLSSGNHNHVMLRCLSAYTVCACLYNTRILLIHGRFGSSCPVYFCSHEHPYRGFPSQTELFCVPVDLKKFGSR